VLFEERPSAAIGRDRSAEDRHNERRSTEDDEGEDDHAECTGKHEP
jgi:hypothetical protein